MPAAEMYSVSFVGHPRFIRKKIVVPGYLTVDVNPTQTRITWLLQMPGVTLGAI